MKSAAKHEALTSLMGMLMPGMLERPGTPGKKPETGNPGKKKKKRVYSTKLMDDKSFDNSSKGFGISLTEIAGIPMESSENSKKTIESSKKPQKSVKKSARRR